MEETKELQKLHRMFQFVIYMLVFLEILIFVYADKVFLVGKFGTGLAHLISKLSKISIYANLFYSKLTILAVICMVSIGTLSKKQLDLDPKKHIGYPLTLGLMIFFGGMWFNGRHAAFIFSHTSWYDIGFILTSVIGAILIHVSMDNISKIIDTKFRKDEWNVEGESFIQSIKKKETPYSVNIPMKFYFKRKLHHGFINVVNPFRGTLLIGTPGSGKSFGVVNPFIRQMIAKSYTMCLYDFKFRS